MQRYQIVLAIFFCVTGIKWLERWWQLMKLSDSTMFVIDLMVIILFINVVIEIAVKIFDK